MTNRNCKSSLLDGPIQSWYFLWMIENPVCSPLQDLIFKIAPYGKLNKNFYLETTNTIEYNLYTHFLWMVPYRILIFMSIGIPRWLITRKTEGIFFFNYPYLKPLSTKLDWNFLWMVFCKIYVFCTDWKSKITTTSEKMFSIETYGKWGKKSQKWMLDWIYSIHEYLLDSP